MFCGNCGTKFDDDVNFCPNCGKSKVNNNFRDKIGIILSNDKLRNGPMVGFVRKVFRNYLEVILWINVISFTIGGWNTGSKIKEIAELVMKELIGKRSFSAAGYPFLGAILGLFVGLLINIILGGFIATITNMDDKIEDINRDFKLYNDNIINSKKK